MIRSVIYQSFTKSKFVYSFIFTYSFIYFQLREVRLRESDPIPGNPLRKSDNSRHFRQELEKEALRFAFLDGRISDVCPSEDETVWALNVKRGFLSAFQNSMEHLDKEQTVLEV